MSSLAGLMAGLTLAASQQAPSPPPDPAAWGTPETPRPKPEQDPLGGRRLGRAEQPVPIDNGVEPLLYRLWGLQPLQSQIVRRGEFVLEAWIHPARGVRQAVIRVTRRRDGRAFVQARAGLGCCTPEIGRRVDIDAELAEPQVALLGAVLADPAWSQPRAVIVDYGGGAAAALCVDGVSWDVTLLVPGQARHLRRACDDAEVGSIAPILSAAVGAAAGRDPRFAAALPPGADFSRQAAAYQSLLRSGGRLLPGEHNRPQPASVPIGPDDADALRPPPSVPAAPATAPRP